VATGLVQFVYWLAVPVMFFYICYKRISLKVFHLAFYCHFICLQIFYFFFGMIAASNFFGWDVHELGVASIVSSYGNLALLGLPVFLAVSKKQNALLPALVLIATHSTILSALTIISLNGFKSIGKKAFQETAYKLITNPVVLALLFGVVCNILSVSLDSRLLHALDILGAAAPGCALVTLGASLGTYELKKPGGEVFSSYCYETLHTHF
jgi:malonate transporter and related proteins